jgi:hypothetical protein
LFSDRRHEISRGVLTSGIIGREPQSSTELSFGDDDDGGTNTTVVIAIRVGSAEGDGSGIGGGWKESRTMFAEVAVIGARDLFPLGKKFPGLKGQIPYKRKVAELSADRNHHAVDVSIW